MCFLVYYTDFFLDVVLGFSDKKGGSLSLFIEWWDSLEAVPTINRLRASLEGIRSEELQKALSRMGPDFSARERKVVEALSKGIINKILHTPVTQLRAPQPRSDRQDAMKIVENLFNLRGSENQD